MNNNSNSVEKIEVNGRGRKIKNDLEPIKVLTIEEVKSFRDLEYEEKKTVTYSEMSNPVTMGSSGF